MILSLERSSSWMNWNARSYIYFNRLVTVDEIIRHIDDVTASDIQRVVQSIFGEKNMSLSAIGPLPKKILEYNKEPIHRLF